MSAGITRATGEDPARIRDEIRDLRGRWGHKLVILTHHYQRPEIVRSGDVRGDSFELAREASRREGVEHIVFCGVLFMAESAAVLARPDQRVYHPLPSALCPLASFADSVQVERALDAIAFVKGRDGVTPIVYMNSEAAVKAVCGARGGTVCTSSNAERAFRWAFERRPSILFIPDEHLGRNTADRLGIPDSEIVVWDPWRENGGLGEAELRSARLVLWRGHCHVHTWFRPEHVAAARRRNPDALVFVHPECRREVVRKADGAGSTRYLVDTVAGAPGGCTLVIGTEMNLVTRLAEENPDKTVLPLARSLCPNMFRITLARLRDTLAALPGAEPVTVDEDVRRDARTALDRMLSLQGTGSVVPTH